MFTPRITATQLMTYYGDAERALRAGDFFTALRLADGEPELTGICRVMLGNEVAGTAMLSRLDAPSPRARLFGALGCWLLGRDDDARMLLTGRDDSEAALVLRAAMAVRRPRIAFFSGTEKMARFVTAVAESGDADMISIGHRPDQVDVAITPMSDAGLLAARVGDGVEALFIDNLTILPPQLAAIAAPRIGHVYDLEHFYAARGREAGWVDCLVMVASGEHLEAGLRYGRPSMVRGVGLTELWPEPDRLKALMRDGSADRPIDVLFTGGIDMPFYPDKRERLARLAQNSGDLRIEIYGEALDRSDYFDLLAKAKYVFSSTRSPNCTPRRLLESLAHGALVMCEKDSSINLIFDTDHPVAAHYDDRQVNCDLKRHVADYRQSVARLVGDRAAAERLLAQMPDNTRATRGFARYVTLLSRMVRAGVSWRAMLGAENSSVERSHHYNPRPAEPAVYAAKHSAMQAYQPALRRELFSDLTTKCGAHGDVHWICAERMVAHASLAIIDRPEHLLRRQGLGRKAAARTLMAMFNKARRETPASLLVWLHIAELLVDLERSTLAGRVLRAIASAWPTLVLDERSMLVTPNFEYEDFGFVNAQIAADLHAHHSNVFGAPEASPRRWVEARMAWLRARVARHRGDMAGLANALDDLLVMGRSDPWYLEQSMMLAVAGIGSDQAHRFLESLCLAFLRGSRLCPRFLNLHFPLAIQALAMLDRVRLARIMIIRFLRARARVQLKGHEILATEAERQMLQTFDTAFADALAAPGARHLLGKLMPWHAAAMPVAQSEGLRA